MEEAKCEHFKICGLYAEADPEAGLCILHSKDPNKDKPAFAHALAQHRKNNGDMFRMIVFPAEVNFNSATFSEQVDFYGTTFSKQADFRGATFSEQADFTGVAFSEQANFIEVAFSKQADFTEATFSEQPIFFGAEFSKQAIFFRATFSKQADFRAATFSKWANFIGAEFSKQADFYRATFSGQADFHGATFSGQANFYGAEFSEQACFSDATFSERVDFRAALFAGYIDFNSASFLAKTIFLGRTEENQRIPVFSNAEVAFKDVNIDPPDALIFKDADLSKCCFQGTDLRQVELTGVSWPKIGKRFGVYDEKVPLETGVTTRPWEHIERIYRQLKQNYEDQRDYERAGDFHYGEKEMRRQNKKTPFGLKFLLTLYWVISGYGERCIRPLICAAILLVASTFGYLALGIAPSQTAAPLTLTSPADWLRVALYGLQTMTLLKPTDLTPIGLAAASLKVFQSFSGPIIFGLFALAIRQRLKR